MFSRISRHLIVIFVALLWVSIAEACPTCKEGIGNNANLVDGYGWSIIFMMSMPFLIFFGLSAYFYYEVRKANRMREIESLVPAVE
jgi:heme/copper-type cytochrome/quinol oxidase subunit 2